MKEIDVTLKEFVPYEIAVQLKELGFKEQCLGIYDDGGNFYHFSDQALNMCEIDAKLVLAPLRQQAFNFLFEKYQYIHIIEDIQVSAGDKLGYRFRWTYWKVMQYYDTCIVDDSLLGCYDMNEAKLKCMQKIIKKIKIEIAGKNTEIINTESHE